MSLESGYKQRKGRRISQIGWQRVPDRRSKKAKGTLPERFSIALWDFEEFSHDERRVRVGSYAFRVWER